MTAEDALSAAMEENLHEYVAFVQRRVPGMFVDDRPDLLLVDSGLPADTFNKILRARLPEADADRRIDEAVAHFRAAGRPFAWWLGPCSQPSDLGRRIESHGLRPFESELGMVIELDRLPPHPGLPPSFEVRRVRDVAALAGFAEIAAGDPPDQAVLTFFERAAPVLLAPDCPICLYTGCLEGRAAAISAMFPGGGVAGVHAVATRPEFQRRGIGLAMTWTALDAGRRLGLDAGVLQASDQGEPLYRRLGFRPCGRFTEHQ